MLRCEPYGFAIDWYCLGAVLYEMLVGLVSFCLVFRAVYSPLPSPLC